MSSPLMAMGIKAMAANYAALQTTGHNIANAHVAGYSRQQVQLATAEGQYNGAGFFGKGVDVVAVTRSHDEFLTREAADARSLAGMDGARLAQLRRLEDLFRPGESGLGHAANQLLNAMVDVASHPADLSARQVALARAAEVASRFGEASTMMDEVQAGVFAELEAKVAEVNSLSRGIAEVNQRIAALRGVGQPPNDLLDERERLISRLSEHLKVSRIEADDGSMAIFVAGGQRLVLGAQAVQLSVVPDAADPSRAAVAVTDTGATRTLAEEALGGGGIAGLLRFQNQDLADARNLVGRLAAALAGAINAQQRLGLNLQPPPGDATGQDLFGIGAPQALPHAGNARDASGLPRGSVMLSVTDSAALQASEYRLQEHATEPGRWQLTRLSDGRTSEFVDGMEIDGVRITLGNPPPQPGDRFLLQPVTRAANGMARLLGDPRDLAAASPQVASPGPGNIGSVGVERLLVTVAPPPLPGATTRITFTDDHRGYRWDLIDAAGATVGSGTGNWDAGQTLPAPPLDINGFRLQLGGAPRAGDTLTVTPTPAEALSTNNGNALALLALRDRALVGGQTVTDAWSMAIAEIGVRVQGARASSDISTAVATQAELSRSAMSGVNLDEEAARLIQFQQSYQAAAKVLQVAQSLFDTLLQATAGR